MAGVVRCLAKCDAGGGGGGDACHYGWVCVCVGVPSRGSACWAKGVSGLCDRDVDRRDGNLEPQ